jgi:hypothetical protein
VQCHFENSSIEQAMPLDQFISETLDALGNDADEILVEAAKPLRARKCREKWQSLPVARLV